MTNEEKDKIEFLKECKEQAERSFKTLYYLVFESLNHPDENAKRYETLDEALEVVFNYPTGGIQIRGDWQTSNSVNPYDSRIFTDSLFAAKEMGTAYNAVVDHINNKIALTLYSRQYPND